MVGRGTRLTPDKLMFRVYDYTNATRLFGEEFITRQAPSSKSGNEAGVDTNTADDDNEAAKEPLPMVEGFVVLVTDGGKLILTQVDGKAVPVTVEEYKKRLAEKLVAEAPTLEKFREQWIDPPARQTMLGNLPDAGKSPFLIRSVTDMQDFDLYDVLAELGYGLAPKTRTDRAESFNYKHTDWLEGLPKETAATLKALASQFARAGTDGLEKREVFQTPEVKKAGGLTALRALGKPADVLRETKARMFTV